METLVVCEWPSNTPTPGSPSRHIPQKAQQCILHLTLLKTLLEQSFEMARDLGFVGLEAMDEMIS